MTIIQSGEVKMKVKAKLIVEDKDFIFDVPTDRCNREEFIPYIKQMLLYSNDIKVDYEVSDTSAGNK